MYSYGCDFLIHMNTYFHHIIQLLMNFDIRFYVMVNCICIRILSLLIKFNVYLHLAHRLIVTKGYLFVNFMFY